MMKEKIEISNSCSKEHILFLKNHKKNILKVKFFQIGILILFVVLWELLAQFKIIDSFLMSSPSRIVNTFYTLYISGQFWNNVICTVTETLVGFLLGTALGIFIATLIWWFPFSFKVIEPYLVVLNALPKVALGPIIIVWMGAGVGPIILMALLLSVIISVINVLSGFREVSKEKVLLMKSFRASKSQIFFKLIFPSNIKTIISTLKINVGMSLIGVITGEFLVSASGIGYLIVYGGQVFKMDLVMTGIIILGFLAWIMYICIAKLEAIYSRKN